MIEQKGSIQFRKDSYAEKILLTIALVGEFPYKKLDLLDGKKRMYQRTILQLKKEGYVSVLGSGDNKTIRITKKSFPILNSIDKRILKHYLDISNNHSFSGGVNGIKKTNRSHRIAEVYTMMDKTNVNVWKHKKPRLRINNARNVINTKFGSCFYDSVELKSADDRQMYKVSFTRIIGLLMSEGGNYCVYNTNKALMKWNSYGEEKAKVLVNDILRSNMKNPPKERIDSAILLGDNMDVALRVLTTNDKRTLDVNKFELLSFDNTYRNIYFLTSDDKGLNQLQLLQQKDWLDKIRTALFAKENIENRNKTVECDATYDNKNILLFFDGNLGRLKRFKNSAFFVGLENMEVICFDWQEDMVKGYLGDEVGVKTIPLKTVLDIFDLKEIRKEE